MRPFLIPRVVVSVWLLTGAPAEAAEPLWLCHQQDGSTLYTTNPAYPGCKEFTPSAGGLTTRPGFDQSRPPSEESQPHKYYEKHPANERRAEDKSKPKGEIDFEKFRMLDTGMTQAEISARVGNPKQVFRFGSNIERWIYTTEDEWLIEITFTSGRVANIDRYRPRP
jgi:hypothetical protein